MMPLIKERFNGLINTNQLNGRQILVLLIVKKYRDIKRVVNGIGRYIFLVFLLSSLA